MKVYLDNSVIGRLMDIERGIDRGSKMLEEDMAVLLDLIELCTAKGNELFTSDEARAEIERVRSTMPQLADGLIDKLWSLTLLPTKHAIPHENNHRNDTVMKYSEDDQNQLDWLVQELKAVLLDKTRITREEKRLAVEWDAYHLAACKENGCDVFLTCDYASIWAYRKLLKRLFSIEVKRPTELFNELQMKKN